MAVLAGLDKAVKGVVHFISGWDGRGKCSANFFLLGKLI